MRIITAITDDYKDLSDLMIERSFYPVERHRLSDEYRIKVSNVWQPLSPWKPGFILNELVRTPKNELLVWVDGDACILQSIEELDTKDYDFAVTARVGPWYFHRRINAGVLFFYPTRKAFDFLEQWMDEIFNTPNGSDQQALNQLLNGIEHRAFPCEIYNWCDWFSYPTDHTKIIHCRAEDRSKGTAWLQSQY